MGTSHSSPLRPHGAWVGLALAAFVLAPFLGCAPATMPASAPHPPPALHSAPPQGHTQTARARIVVLPLRGAQASSAAALAQVLREGGLGDVEERAAWAPAGLAEDVEVIAAREMAVSAAAARRVGEAHGADWVLWGEVVRLAEEAGRAVVRTHLVAVRGAAPRGLRSMPIDYPPLAVEEPAAAAVRPVHMLIGPGGFAPGGQPVACYIGNVVHDEIGKFYERVHRGESIRLNTIPIQSILDSLGLPVPPGTSKGVLRARPDIVNFTRRHLFEIKPADSPVKALAEVLVYQAYLRQVGIHLDLGPPGEPGTQGIVPAPNGYAVFGVVSPGIIAYRCFRGSYRQTAEEPAIEVVLRPRRAGRVRDFMDAISRATGLTGMALYVYIVVSEGTRFVFPARNLVPVP